ncbi:MAG: SH3 domain-containing protein [Lachnospiraceae bacterium]|nr:SH3 domain-containing protein [Candidatus Colinaster equi]
MMRKSVNNIKAIMMAVTMCAATVMLSSAMYVHADGTAKVTADGAKIRSNASTSADVVASVGKGEKLEILSQTTSDDGYTWYKIRVNGSDRGYVRADLVGDVEGSISKESASDTSNSTDAAKKEDTSSNETKVETVETNVVESSVLTAKVTGDAVTVRKGASTKTDKVGTAEGGIEVSVSGEATDSDGKTWYQVSFGDVNGFIRSDFLEVLTTAEDEQPTEEEVETSEEPEEPVVSQDYEVKFETNNEGVDEWFLYDHIRGTKQSINNIYAVMQQNQDMADSDSSSLKTLKIVVIAMAVVILGLIIGVTILLFKVRDSYEEMDDFDRDYEDDEDEEEEEEEEYIPAKRSARGRRGASRRRRYDDYEDEEDDDEEEDDEDEEDEEEYVRPARRKKESAKQSTKHEAWPTRGMLDVDDDMEFEFLDLED